MLWRSESKLRTDLVRWREAGWVTPAGETAILSELSGRKSFNAASVLSVLGAALLCFAAMSFVAAHWNDVPRFLRLTGLLGLMVGAYALAAELFARKLDGFAHAALLAGAGLFGANIMLVSQMYHIDGNPPDGVLLWALGTLVTGAVAGSRPVLGLALVLISLWGGWETTLRSPVFYIHDGSGIYWPYLIGWAAVTAAIAARGWNYGLHLCGVALSLFVISCGFLAYKSGGHELVFLTGLAASGVALWLRYAPDTMRPVGLPEWVRGAEAIIPYALSVAGAGLYGAQMGGFDRHDSLGVFLFWAVLGLGLSVATILLSGRTGQKSLARIGYIGFGIEALTIYFRTVGTLLGSSAFFLMAGGLLVGLAVLALKIERRTAALASAGQVSSSKQEG